MQATTVAAQGEAKTDFNLAGFSVYLSALEADVPTAKTELKKKVDALMESLDAMRTKLDLKFVKNSIRASSNVQQQWAWEKVKGKDTNVLKGYQATYSYSFQIDDLDKVSKVYDTLTSLPEIRVGSPSYSLKNQDKLNKKALKDAFQKVSDRFADECNILGLNPADFEIVTWETSYSDSRRSDRVAAGMKAHRMSATVAMAYSADDVVESAAGGGSSELELVAGQAQVTVNLEVGFARKAVPAQPVANTDIHLKGTVVLPPGRTLKINERENGHV
jgi:uncharacterized protein YggE